MLKARIWRERKLKEVPHLQLFVSNLPQAKGASVLELQNHIAVLFQQLPALLQHFGSLGHRKQARKVNLQSQSAACKPDYISDADKVAGIDLLDPGNDVA